MENSLPVLAFKLYVGKFYYTLPPFLIFGKQGSQDVAHRAIQGYISSLAEAQMDPSSPLFGVLGECRLIHSVHCPRCATLVLSWCLDATEIHCSQHAAPGEGLRAVLVIARRWIDLDRAWARVVLVVSGLFIQGRPVDVQVETSLTVADFR